MKMNDEELSKVLFGRDLRLHFHGLTVQWTPSCECEKSRRCCSVNN